MPADYQIQLIDPETGDQLDLIDNRRILKLQYTKKLHDYGTMQLTILSSDAAAAYQTLTDMLMRIYRDNGSGFEAEETYLLRYSEPTVDENADEFLIFGGEAILSLFAYRVIRVEDDPLGANGYSTKSGFADAVMAEFVDNQAVTPAVDNNRIIPGLSIAPVGNVGQQVFKRVDGGTLLEVLQSMTTKGNTDFELRHTGGVTFEFFAGLIGGLKTKDANYPFNPFIYFTPERGNMRNPRMTIDRRGEITATYVQGQGAEDDRQELLVVSGAANDSPFNRRENLSDAREIENTATRIEGLLTSGTDELYEKRAKQVFSFQIDTDAPQGKYNVDWEVGDRVTAQYKGIEASFRIMGVEINIEGNSETIEPTLEIQ